MKRILIAALLAAALLAGPSGAVLVATPLRMTASPGEADVGANVTFNVTAANASEERAYAGRTLLAEYTAEGAGEPPARANGTIARVTLDAQATARFSWRVPEAVRDMNVFVVLQDGNDTAASAHVRVGNAPAIAFAMGGEAPGQPAQPGSEPGTNGTGQPGEGTAGGSAASASRATPGPGIAPAAVAVAGLALLARRRA